MDSVGAPRGIRVTQIPEGEVNLLAEVPVEGASGAGGEFRRPFHGNLPPGGAARWQCARTRSTRSPTRGRGNSTHRENLDGGVGQFHDEIGEQAQVEHASQADIKRKAQNQGHRNC